ncbi:signal transduction histidine kinase [Actinomadura pelletieri DSM 43383]|uniref:histidine kinase n=1 Tax=Actinomadura pelletieri DSM 43383 TaxID=1120940 RepID=A0A495QUV2_9ACTN|nr:sensor domain-containing protein [Actinomadura pelletieri]RKS77289.1 signal transduction histidine kinase [Actinomadura pelletieri DSM 43383]
MSDRELAIGPRFGAYGRRAFTTFVRAIVQIVMAYVGNLSLFILTVLSLAFIPLGIGVVLVPVMFQAIRTVANLQRAWAAEWSGVEIPVPYRPEPAGGLGLFGRLRWTLSDPASWRDLLWTLLNVPVALVLGVLATGVTIYGLEGVLVAPWLAQITDYGWGPFWMLDEYGAFGVIGSIVLGAALTAVSVPLGPALLRVHALFCQSLLAPTRAALTERVQRLAETRSETVDASAAELRRIERDLHDGAQARLVALSMNIGLAEEMMRDDPETARQLLAEARAASGSALTELRDLVRGIHPPVLAERGLDGAVRALALTLPLPVDVRIDLPGRPDAPVESAAYFAVAEMLANVVKHSGSRNAWLQIEHADGRLLMIVGDDGTGGADLANGSGMRGIERRLAAFDGTMAVTSPPGGPTVVTMELPCALSSPKISPSSETG